MARFPKSCTVVNIRIRVTVHILGRGSTQTAFCRIRAIDRFSQTPDWRNEENGDYNYNHRRWKGFPGKCQCFQNGVHIHPALLPSTTLPVNLSSPWKYCGTCNKESKFQYSVFEIACKRRVHFTNWKPQERLTMKVCVISTHELILIACERWQEF